ncbi:hypothetical protein ACQFYA_18300 [Promicromonospora sp. Marseille-Q5078]
MTATVIGSRPSDGSSARRRRRGVLGLVVVIVLAGAVSGCGIVDSVLRKAYCSPHDPVVTPTSVAPGDEVHVEIDGVGHHSSCSSTLPSRARYGISIRSLVDGTGDPDLGTHFYNTDLTVLDPSSDGVAEGTVHVPDDVPVGEAEISVNITVPTPCEVDPTASCAANPSAVVEIGD